MDTVIYGADSETLHGKPMTLQFYSEHVKCDEIIFVNAKNATEKFLEWCGRRARNMNHVLYVHNLDFDLPEFLWSEKQRLVAVTGGEFSFVRGEWHISGVYGKPTFCRITNKKRHIQILIVDSYLWFQTSLAKAAEIVCPDLPKLRHIKRLGEVQFTRKDTAFVKYAMRDAVVCFHLGVAVNAIHREFDIRQAVSLADMSAKIFRHHFLKYTIPQPPRDVIMGAWKSYHGGKNNVAPDCAPAWHVGITALDISSAYPYAMHTLPAFSDRKLYKRIAKTKRIPKNIPPYGVYCVSGVVKECVYPVLFSHGFQPLVGKISDVWVQGLELREAIDSGEFQCTSLRGFYYEHEKDKQPPALRAFVEHFYKLKNTEKNEVRRYMYKIILNALYGKFIQTRKGDRVIYTDIDGNDTVETGELIAGGMFHPFIATAITAHTRVYIHQIEHAHKAIHTATDGIFTYAKKPKALRGRPRSGLGSLSIEARGDVCILRNKCYILYAPNGKVVSQYFKGKRIKKYAMHGFQGKVFDLEKLISHRMRKYTATRPNRLREALKRGLDVNKFETREYVLKVGRISVYRRPRT